jgi:formamidopyrimidine-DNA glycosylase
MPELPEVETVRRQLSKEIIGRIIKRLIAVADKSVLPNAEVVRERVIGKKFVGVNRRAKLLILELSEELYLTVHLKLNGRIFLKSPNENADQYLLCKIILDDGSELTLNDSRKFAYLHLIEGKDQIEKIIQKYGREPLKDLSLQDFVNLLSNSNKRMKDLLMDQSMIAGVGNIYANDALWLAKVHPASRANHLTTVESTELFNALEQVLNESLADGGASDHWYRQLHGEKGKYQEHFKVYGRTGEPCRVHPAEKIQYIKVSQRGTFICPICQVEK